MGFSLCRCLANHPAALLDGPGFDLLTSSQAGLGPVEVDIGRGQVAEVLVVVAVVAVVDETVDRLFERSGQVGCLRQDPVLEGLMPALRWPP